MKRTRGEGVEYDDAVMYCAECESNIRVVQVPVAEKQSRIGKACECEIESHDSLPYEVDGWVWE